MNIIILYKTYIFILTFADGKEIVLKYGCIGFENNKDLIESTNDDFLREMDRYIESHRYFSMYLWLDKKMHPLELDVEHVL